MVNGLASSDVLTVEVELGGRHFPCDGTTNRGIGANRIYRLQEKPTDASLAERLHESIQSSLAWTKLNFTNANRENLVETYISTLHQLGDRRRELEMLMRAACEVNLEFRQAEGETHAKSRDAAMSRQMEKLLGEAEGIGQAPRNILNAARVSRPVAELRTRLDLSVAEIVTDFTARFLSLLARLVDCGQVGLVEWLPNNCCSYHFFRHIVLQHRAPTIERQVRRTLTSNPDETAFYEVAGMSTVEQTVRGQHTFRLARHEHEVMQAVRTTIGNSQVVLPLPVVRLIEKVPGWLYPFIEIIDGQIFRERIIERDISTTEWSDVQVRDEPIYGRDPGLIIGPYVLVGWGPREIEQENRRRNAALEVERSFDNQRETTPVWLKLTRALLVNS